MFSLPKSEDVYFSYGARPIEHDGQYVFTGLSGNEIVVHHPESGSIVLYYYSDVRNQERKLTIDYIYNNNKFSAVWNNILALSKLLGDIPGVEETIWYHVAEWLTQAPKDSFSIVHADPK